MKSITLHKGYNLDYLKTLADDSIDSIVTDGPYGLSKEPDMLEVLKHWLNGDDYTHKHNGFMGKSWDSFVPGPAIWKECFRVLKPGGYLLNFYSARTYDMGVLAIRLAGFEIRDQIMWLYGNGFPKSLDVSKTIDKQVGAEREVVGRYQPPNGKVWNLKNDTQEGRSSVAHGSDKLRSERMNITAPSSAGAQQWDGWGTALKPGHEPIVLARKPLAGTVAQNVLTHGTGGLNIDATRVEFTGDADRQGAMWGRGTDIMGGNFVGATHSSGKANIEANPQGRFPANVIHDGSEEVMALFPNTGISAGGSRGAGGSSGIYSPIGAQPELGPLGYGDSGSAARFFYCAKATRRERNRGLPADIANDHPTVKPIALMRYLVRLVTPPGGTCLDLYAGSGTTPIACIEEGFSCIAIEEQEHSFRIMERRVNFIKQRYHKQEALFA